VYHFHDAPVPKLPPVTLSEVVVGPQEVVIVLLAAVGAVDNAFTVIVNVDAVPGQPFAVGVTVIVAVTADEVVFTAVKEAIFPLPLAARPIDGVLFVQLNVVPATGLPNVIAVVAVPAQSVWLATAFTVAVGFTVMVNVFAAPVQPFAVGVTVIVAVTGALVVFTPLNEGIFPVPLAARPMDGVLFVQL
jgi:hypothetical protein